MFYGYILRRNCFAIKTCCHQKIDMRRFLSLSQINVSSFTVFVEIYYSFVPSVLERPCFPPILMPFFVCSAITDELHDKWQGHRRSSNTEEDLNITRWEQLKHVLQSGKQKVWI